MVKAFQIESSSENEQSFGYCFFSLLCNLSLYSFWFLPTPSPQSRPGGGGWDQCQEEDEGSYRLQHVATDVVEMFT